MIRFLSGFAVPFLWSAFLPAAGAADEAEPDRAVALYEEAFDLLDVDLTDSERDALYGESDEEIGGEARTRIREGLEVFSRGAAAESVAWPTDEREDELFSRTPYLGPARNAARLGTWYATEIGHEDPDAALDILRSTLALSRHLDEDGMLIHLLTSIAIEGITYSAVESLAGKWEPEHRERLLEIIATEAPDRSVAETVAREGEYLLSRMREALYSVPEDASLAEVMRISSIAIFPGETWISVEHVGLDVSFRLKPGETRHGVELVSFDPENDRAVVRSGGEEAVVHLESRKIESLNLPGFFTMLGVEADGNVASRLVEEGEDWFGVPSLGNSLTGDESDAEVALFFLEETEAAYEFLAEHLSEPFGALATDRDREAELDFPEGTGPLAEQLASGIMRLRLSEQAAKTAREMAVTALQLLDDPETQIPADAFSSDGEPLVVTREQEAIEVQSRYEMGRDRAHSIRIER